MEYYGSGTLGDAYNAGYLRTFICNEPNELIYWSTKHSYWEDKIREIFLMFDMRVEFLGQNEIPDENCYRLVSAPLSLPGEGGGLRLNLSLLGPEIKKHVDIRRKNYLVLQPHAGKPPISDNIMGSNSKFMSLDEVMSAANNYDGEVWLVGTHPYYEKLHAKGLCNYVGRTNIHELAYIIDNAAVFMGPIGLASFIALSNQVPSYLHDAYEQPYLNRILPNYWHRYCMSFKIKKYLGTLK